MGALVQGDISLRLIPIDEQTITGTVFTALPWGAGAYRFLKLVMRSSGAGATLTGCTITLPGLTGNYTHGNIYNQGSGAPTSDANTAWIVTWDVNAWASLEFDIRKGGPRSMSGFNRSTGGGSAIRQFVIGDNDDTTHDVTGMVATMGGSGTFTATLMGIP